MIKMSNYCSVNLSIKVEFEKIKFELYFLCSLYQLGKFLFAKIVSFL